MSRASNSHASDAPSSCVALERSHAYRDGQVHAPSIATASSPGLVIGKAASSSLLDSYRRSPSLAADVTPSTAGSDDGHWLATHAADDVLTVAQAARLLRIGRNQLYEAIGRGEIPHRRIGRVIRLSRRALSHWLAGT